MNIRGNQWSPAAKFLAGADEAADQGSGGKSSRENRSTVRQGAAAKASVLYVIGPASSAGIVRLRA
jgi:hypothetical protein